MNIMKELLLATLAIIASTEGNPAANSLLLHNTLPFPGFGYGFQRVVVPHQASQSQPGFMSIETKSTELVSGKNECFNSSGDEVSKETLLLNIQQCQC